jgi:uncharacterized FAD-dependent dehydrogenase
MSTPPVAPYWPTSLPPAASFPSRSPRRCFFIDGCQQRNDTVWANVNPARTAAVVGNTTVMVRAAQAAGCLRLLARVVPFVAGDARLGTAPYKFGHHGRDGRTAYSFCMCPGGRVVAAASEEGRVVTNGMSQHSRAEFNANSGIVVDISPERDFPGGPLAGVELQRHWETQAFLAGGSSYQAPGQRLEDFVAGRPSTALGSIAPSYKPGVHPSDLSTCLPDFVTQAIREALPVFGRKMPGYDHPDVVLTGVESRTSSPIRIRRGENCQSINTSGLYPAGEGAGYAGGILSAAVDGITVAEALALTLDVKKG